MVYLDYSATTPINDEVMSSFIKSSKYIGNPNSLHKLGVEAKNIIEASTNQIKKLLDIEHDVIYTSGSSEANNLAIKGVCDTFKSRGKHIITTSLEHSSIYGPINYLLNQGYSVDFVDLDANGCVDLKSLESLITDDTILVSINAVNSELGIMQPIKEISKIVKKYPKCLFHSDMTQAIGKVNIPIKDIDLVSFSAHKFFGIKGIGVLLKSKTLKIEPLIHGGKSTTVFRSGTPCTNLIISLAKALRLSLENIDQKCQYVSELNSYLQKHLQKYEKVKINSNSNSIPHILNISILGVKPEVMQHALEEYDIYISTQSACSSSNTISKAVMAVTNDKNRATSSIRISLSYITTKNELDYFLKSFDICYKKLQGLKNENN